MSFWGVCGGGGGGRVCVCNFNTMGSGARAATESSLAAVLLQAEDYLMLGVFESRQEQLSVPILKLLPVRRGCL